MNTSRKLLMIGMLLGLTAIGSSHAEPNTTDADEVTDGTQGCDLAMKRKITADLVTVAAQVQGVRDELDLHAQNLAFLQSEVSRLTTQADLYEQWLQVAPEEVDREAAAIALNALRFNLLQLERHVMEAFIRLGEGYPLLHEAESRLATAEAALAACNLDLAQNSIVSAWNHVATYNALVKGPLANHMTAAWDHHVKALEAYDSLP